MKASDGGSQKPRSLPEPQHATRLFLIILALSLISGIWLVETLGLSLNLWINQLIFVLIPVIIAARGFNWDMTHVFRLRKPGFLILLFSCVSGLGIGFIASSMIPAVERLLSSTLGPAPSALLLMDRVNYFEIPLDPAVIFGLVLLAPFCEGLFFRGFMQKSFEVYGLKNAWVYSGVLFGLLYIINGISNVGPFILLGLFAGYVTLVSGSVWHSMAAHSVCNATIIIVSPMMGMRASRVLSGSWNLMLLVTGTCLIILSILLVRNRAKGLSELAEEEKTGATGGRHYSLFHQPLRTSLALWCALLIIVGMGFAEGVLRVGAFSLPGRTLSDSARTRVSVVHNRISIASFDLTDLREGRSAILKYSYSVYSSEADISIAIVDPNDRVVDSTAWKGSPVSQSITQNEVTLNRPGLWSAVVLGSARDLDILLEWSIVYK